jgi:hypothetical protein
MSKLAGVALPEFMVRVKLPDPNGYSSGPSGDTDYDCDYHSALSAATPEGFEVITERTGERRPVDSQRFTYVRLRCVDPNSVVANLYEEVKQLRTWLDNITAAVEEAR